MCYPVKRHPSPCSLLPRSGRASFVFPANLTIRIQHHLMDGLDVLCPVPKCSYPKPLVHLGRRLIDGLEVHGWCWPDAAQACRCGLQMRPRLADAVCRCGPGLRMWLTDAACRCGPGLQMQLADAAQARRCSPGLQMWLTDAACRCGPGFGSARALLGLWVPCELYTTITAWNLCVSHRLECTRQP